MEYRINGRSRTLLYVLADGIYPSFSIFVKTIENRGNNRKEKCFAKDQEDVRKDVEQEFSVLLFRWKILERTLRLWYRHDI